MSLAVVRGTGVLAMEPRGKLIRPKKSNVQLMFNTHDPLEEIHRAERAQEDDYFRKLDQELIVALRAKSAAEIEQVIRQYTRMRCPKCGEPLKATPSHLITIVDCHGCGRIRQALGTWERTLG